MTVFGITTILSAAALAIPPVAAAPQQRPDPQATVRAFVAAFNARDIDAMLALADDDIQWIMIEGDRTTVETSGKEALRTSMTAYFRSCPTCRSSIEIGLATAARVVGIETASWTGPAGERSQKSLSVYELQDDRIRRVYYYPSEK